MNLNAKRNLRAMVAYICQNFLGVSTSVAIDIDKEVLTSENGFVKYDCTFRQYSDDAVWNPVVIQICDVNRVSYQALLEEFKCAYKKTRNYTLLTEDLGYSDDTIFRGLVKSDGFACVLSAWEMYLEAKGLGVVPNEL